jgi:hypothetical protein
VMLSIFWRVFAGDLGTMIWGVYFFFVSISGVCAVYFSWTAHYALSQNVYQKAKKEWQEK